MLESVRGGTDGVVGSSAASWMLARVAEGVESSLPELLLSYELSSVIESGPMGSSKEASSVDWGVVASESIVTECVFFFLDDVDSVSMPLSSASEASKTFVVEPTEPATWSVEAKSADDVRDGKNDESRVSEASSVSSLKVELEVALLSVSISEFGVANVTSVDVVEDSTCSADVKLS